MTSCSPLTFARACARIQALFDDEPDLALSLTDLSDVTQLPMSLCTTACASLVNARVLKWSGTATLVRADASPAIERRRTA